MSVALLETLFTPTALPLEDLDAAQHAVSETLVSTRRSMLGQFMTPARIASFMAGLFTINTPTRVLDAGAGVGMLSAAFARRARELGVDCALEVWEVDPALQPHLRNTVCGLTPDVTVHAGDFIEEAVLQLWAGGAAHFTHAILNPPYKKISSDSHHRHMLRKAGIETVNLYTAFVGLAILMLKDGGELVAIIPRSFCNGTYYRPFRELLLRQCAIRQIHLFESRADAFKADAVLQENVIIHLVKHGQQGDVTVSTSSNAMFENYVEQRHPFDQIVKTDHAEYFIHVPAGAAQPNDLIDPFTTTLAELDLQVSTGPVVDFRAKEFWASEPAINTVPLLYPHHFANGALAYPRRHKKPNALIQHPDVDKMLMPAGHYVVTKRFTSKEEARRLVAFTLSPDVLCGERWGFENHLNVIHFKKQGIDPVMAHGMAAFLNSTHADQRFRAFSGHTQVNATDLRMMTYPTLAQLLAMGRLAITSPKLTPDQIFAEITE